MSAADDGRARRSSSTAATMPCPMPVIELARHLADVEVGELLAVVAHDAAAAVDVPAWCRMKEQDYVGADVADDGAPRYVVRRLS